MVRKNTDTVPAKLTPREAVLNRNAAELLGRDTIKRLNDHGNMLTRRGVDLAALPSDPTPGPSTENMLGYEYGTNDVPYDPTRYGLPFSNELGATQWMNTNEAIIPPSYVTYKKPQTPNDPNQPDDSQGYQRGTSMVQGDDRSDLLADADTATYGGIPAPTPTPTPPVRGYAYGTSSVDDPKKRYNRKWDINPISTSQYIGRGGTPLGPQYDQQTAAVNPLPTGAVGVQGSLTPPASTSSFASTKPMSHTEMAADIARRNLTATGSTLGTQKPSNDITPGFQGYVSPEYAAAKNLYWSGQQTGWQTYGGNGADRNFSNVNSPSQNTVHFLPPGFTATTGSTGTPNSSPNDIHFLPPGFSSVQGVTNPVTKQLQQPKDETYGSAYGY